MEYLTFHVGEREFGIDLGRVREIVNPLPITRVPGMPSALLGLVGLRGDPAPVVDAGLRLAGRAVERSARTPLLVLSVKVQDQPTELALLVEAAGRKLTVDSLLPWSEGLARFAGADACTGFADVEGRMVIVLDVDRLLAFERVAAHVERPRLATGRAPTPALGPSAGSTASPGRTAAPTTAPTGPSLAPPAPGAHASPPASPPAAWRPRSKPQAPPRGAVTPTRAPVTPTRAPVTPTRAPVPRTPPVRFPIPGAEAPIPPRGPADASAPLTSPTPLRAGRSGLGWLVAASAAGLAVALFLLAPGSARRPDASPRSAPRTAPAAALPVRATASIPHDVAPAEFAPPPPSAVASALSQAPETAAPPTAVAAVEPPRQARAPRQLPPSMVVTPETPACEIHEVRKGESLWAIARRKLGDPYRWTQLFGENRDRIVDPDVIEIDDRIRIPGACRPVEK